MPAICGIQSKAKDYMLFISKYVPIFSFINKQYTLFLNNQRSKWNSKSINLLWVPRPISSCHLQCHCGRVTRLLNQIKHFRCVKPALNIACGSGFKFELGIYIVAGAESVTVQPPGCEFYLHFKRRI